jgi:hypothetical protein
MEHQGTSLGQLLAGFLSVGGEGGGILNSR